MFPGALPLQSCCVFSDVPAKTYGQPTKRSARETTCRSHDPSVRDDEGRHRVANRCDPAGVEQAELGERVRGLGARRRLVRRALEALAADRVVHAKPEQPRDGLRADHVGRLEPGVAGREADRAGRGQQPRGGDELRVELAHRHEPIGDRSAACAASRARGSPRAAPLASARRRAGTTRRRVPSPPRGRPRRSAARPSSCRSARSARGPRRARPRRRSTGRASEQRGADEAESKAARARHLLSYRTPRSARLIGLRRDANEIRTAGRALCARLR